MTLGSLFDGSGGFPLAGVLNGITPIWASEIEPYPLRVTALRFPDMIQLGDITKIDGAKIEPVDIITFGSPCQDLSVAGKQAGLREGERSSLFYEAIRVIQEMRDATDGKYPRFLVWENVPGAFSSNGGSDFREVLQSIVEIVDVFSYVPQPKKWQHAGCIVGDGYSLAWRVYDAQFWGVPQRRKRVYLIADFGSERAREILFEPESLSGNPEQSSEERQGTAADAEGSSGRSHIPCYPINTMVATRHNADDGRTTFGIGEPNDPQFTLQAGHEHAVCYEPTEQSGRGSVKCLNPWDIQSCRQYSTDGAFTALQACENSGLNRQGVVYPTDAIAIDQQGGKSNCGYADGVMMTLCSDSHGTPHAVCYDAKGNDVTAFTQNQRNEVRDLNGKSAALSAQSGMKQQTYLAIENHAMDCRVTLQEPDTPVQTLNARMGTGGGAMSR